MLIVVFLVTATVFAFVPVVHAGGTLAQKGASSTTAGTSSATCCGTAGSTTGTGVLAVPTYGNVMVVGVSGTWAHGGAPPTVTSVTDNLGNSYSLQSSGQCNNCGNFESFDAEVWTAPITQVGSNPTITVTMSCICGSGGILLAVNEVAGIGATASSTSSGNAGVNGGGAGTWTTTTQTSQALTLASGGWAFSAQESGAAVTSGTGYTCVGYNAGGSACNGGAGQYYNSQYGTIQSGVVSPTQFPLTHASAYWDIAGAVFPLVSSNPTGVQTLGSCPTKNTATQTLTNSTIYMYEGLTPTTITTVGSMSTFLASTVGSGSHTLRLLIYAQSATAAISVNVPLVKQAEYSYTFSSGSKNQLISQALTLALGSQVYWAVGIVGDDHIKVNQSSLAGMYTQTGNPSTQAQPSTFSSAGSGSGVQLYLCASATFSASVTVTTFSTITSTLTTTSVSTAVAPTNNPTVALDNLLLGVIVLLGPSLLIAGLTKSLWGGILGAVLGLTIGVYAGFLPLWSVAVVLITALAALFFARTSGTGGGV